MASDSTLTVRILGDSSGFKKSADEASSDAEKAAGRITKAGAGMTVAGAGLTAGVTVPLIGLGTAALGMASDVEESQSKVNVVFDESSAQISAWADTSAESMGLSRGAYLDTAGSLGVLYTQLGFTTDEAATMQQQFQQTNADLASFYNLPVEEVSAARQAAYRGEYDSLQRMVPTINAASVEQKAMEMTGKKNADQITEQEKALAINQITLESTTAAQGDFARTQDGAANKQRILNAQWEDAQATLGDKLMPVFNKVLGIAVSLVEGFSGLSGTWQTVIMVVGGLAAAIGPLLLMLGPVVSLFGLVSGAAAAAGVGIGAFLAPILAVVGIVVAVIAAIAALVAAIWWLYNNNESFRNGVQKVWEAIKQTVMNAVNAVVAWVQATWPKIQEAISHVMAVIQVVIQVALAVVEAIWNTIGANIMNIVGTVFNWIKTTIETVVNIIKNIIEFALNIINGEWGAAWQNIKNIFGAAWDWIVATLGSVLSIVGQIIGGALSFIRNLWDGAWNGIKNAADAIWGTIQSVISGHINFLVGLVTGLPGRVTSAVSGMWNGISDGFKSVINSVIRMWNDFSLPIPSADIPFIGKVGGGSLDTPNIPYLHTGGIYRAPSGQKEGLAMLLDGERVLTPDQAAGGNIYVNVEGSVVTERDLVQSLREAFIKINKRNGTVGFV